MFGGLQIGILAGIVFLHHSNGLFAQSQTTGRIAGFVNDPSGAGIGGVKVTTDGKKPVVTNDNGYYEFPLPPGSYKLAFTKPGFSEGRRDVQVFVTETTPLNVQLQVSEVATAPVTVSAPPGPNSVSVVDSASEFPQAKGNFTQLLGAFLPGVSVALADNTARGRNSQNLSVNGARPSHDNFQINGIDANRIDSNTAGSLAVPALETIQEIKFQTLPYDAAYGRGAGGSVQAVTRSGGNSFHGKFYGYFRNEALNANDPFLKAAQVPHPTLRRTVVGALAGGPIRRDRTFFFISYQGAREQNGAADGSLSDVMIAPGLTDDRSVETLLATFNPPRIHPVSLSLLNAKLPDGRFLIPTPQPNGRYSGSEVSTYREDQFNINGDHRFGPDDWLSVKFFYSDAPGFIALASANVPGFGADQKLENRLLSIQFTHAFSSRTVNEARAGYNGILGDTFGRQPVRDVDMGISRANADEFPGLGVIRIGPAATGALTIGNSGSNVDLRNQAFSVTLADTLSMSRGKHNIRAGGGTVLYRDTLTTNNNRRGMITFSSFDSFLVGVANGSINGNGINTRRMRLADYSFFLQDDWTFSSRLTLNLGLRYELFLPPLETSGAIGTFDPELYKPRMEVDASGVPVGPPAEGFVQAGNVIPALDSPDIPNVGKRMFKSIDPNNLAPKVAFAYNPPLSGRLILRGGYGISNSRLSTAHIGLTINAPPLYAVYRSPRGTVPFENPYYPLPSQDQFPTLVPGVRLAGNVFDRGIRTPYFHQYSLGVQWTFSEPLVLEASYAGTRGLNLLRSVTINQAVLASSQQPITNAVTGQVITTNSPANVVLRTPYQGVEAAGLQQIQSTGQSSYNSLQLSLTHRKRKGLLLSASYTYSKSIDNGSGSTGSAGNALETSATLGNQLDPRANRGLSTFDRTHRFVLNAVWNLPGGDFGLQSSALRKALSNWQVSGIVTAMSGSPIDIVDGGAGEFYGLNNGNNNPLARPNWAPGADRKTATTNIPPGYFFNPFAFTRPVVQANQPIPSSLGRAIANATGTDIGSVGRNVLRGPAQSNVDIAMTRRFPRGEQRSAELRVEFFNLFNQVNLSNPISNLSAASVDNNGTIVAPGDFGRITSTSSNPRLIQLALKFNW